MGRERIRYRGGDHAVVPETLTQMFLKGAYFAKICLENNKIIIDLMSEFLWLVRGVQRIVVMRTTPGYVKMGPITLRALETAPLFPER